MAFKHFALHVEIHKAQKNMLPPNVHILTYVMAIVLSSIQIWHASFLSFLLTMHILLKILLSFNRNPFQTETHAYMNNISIIIIVVRDMKMLKHC